MFGQKIYQLYIPVTKKKMKHNICNTVGLYCRAFFLVFVIFVLITILSYTLALNSPKESKDFAKETHYLL